MKNVDSNIKSKTFQFLHIQHDMSNYSKNEVMNE